MDEIALRNVRCSVRLETPADPAGEFSAGRITAVPSLSWCPSLQHAGYWKSSTVHRRSKSETAAMWTENGRLLQDVFSAALTLGVGLGVLFFWGETAKKRIFEQAGGHLIARLTWSVRATSAVGSWMMLLVD
ncbi:hypothetical protein KSP40_PGU004816 [Platanthera guangdongensis]|uniref:Uncharacterized protein n=1 Tax=Platanthera guangdongensis TaxID=2320717 RepID=A0ABR2M2G1_9ASPA